MAHPRTYSNLSPRRQPFIFLTGAFVAGILLDQWLNISLLLTTLLLLLSISGGLAVYRAAQNTRAALFILAGFIAAGIGISAAGRGTVPSDALKRLMEDGLITATDPVRLSGILEHPPEPVPDGVLLDVRAQELQIAGRILKASGSARLMLPLGDENVRSEYDELRLDYGSDVRILLRLEPARNYSNPGSPDFNDFLERRGYQLKGNIKSPLLVEVLRRTSGNPLLGALYRARLWFMTRIDQRFPARIAGTLKAMLAGNRYFVDPQTAVRLRQSAAFHILVIAGLHIGIIAWLILGGHSTRRRNHVRILVSLTALWAYAIAVGMEPPVVRATTMITVGILGPMIFRRSVSLNTVALSGFVMVIFNPELVFDPGFQMSFVAVAGIVGLAVPLADRLRQVGNWRPSASTPHPPAQSRLRTLAEILFWDERSFQNEVNRSDIKYNLDKSRSAVFISRWLVQPVIRYMVLLVITSVAIQLATLPLMILYFNRVAPVGILINIVAGLLAGIMMAGSFLTICLAGVSAWLSAAIGHVVVGAHHLLVNAVVPFLSIPGASFRTPHYAGSGRLLYGLYYVPMILFVLLLDRWRPVEVFLPIAWLKRKAPKGAPVAGTAAAILARTAASGLASSAGTSGPPISSLAGRGMWARALRSIRLPAVQAMACLMILALLIVAINRPLSAIGRGSLAVYFLDVGQGDSALVVFPGGSTMLVDAGGEIHIGAGAKQRGGKRRKYDLGELQGDDDGWEQGLDENTPGIGEVVVSRFLWSLGLRRLDYALATHAHEDHIGGFEDVLQNFAVGELFLGHPPNSSPELRRLIHRARVQHVRVGSLGRGDSFTLDGVEVVTLWPPRGDKNSLSGNNDSVVLHLKYGSVSFLLAGDIEGPAETWLCNSNADLSADLLKVPHHGSKTSSTFQFIDKVKPNYAVVSVGVRSRFGHPHPEIIGRYADRGIHLLETGRDGMVTAETDGSRLVVRTFLASQTPQ